MASQNAQSMDGATVKPLTKLNDQNYTLHLRDLLFFARETPACPAYPGGQLASHRAVKLRTRLDAAMVRGRSQTRSRCSSEGGVVRHDLYAEVSARIVAELERGAAPWIKPWSATAGANTPCNTVTNRPYSGCNVVLLWIAANAGYRTPRYLTFKQALELGGNVRKGEHGTKVYFVKQLRVPDREGEDGETRIVSMMREYTVFNVDQCEATGALRLRRGQADLRQVHPALLQGEYARAHPAGDALGGSAHAKAPSRARCAAHDRRPSAGASPASVAIAQLQGIAAQEAAGQHADTGNRDQDERGAQPRLTEGQAHVDDLPGGREPDGRRHISEPLQNQQTPAPSHQK